MILPEIDWRDREKKVILPVIDWRDRGGRRARASATKSLEINVQSE
jgi:hypothetical protein